MYREQMRFYGIRWHKSALERGRTSDFSVTADKSLIVGCGRLGTMGAGGDVAFLLWVCQIEY